MTKISISELTARLDRNIYLFNNNKSTCVRYADGTSVNKALEAAIISDATYIAKAKGDMAVTDAGFENFKEAFMYYVKNLMR